MWPARWCFRRLHPDTGNQLHDDRVTAVREEPDFHREFWLGDVTDGMPSPWKLPVDVVPGSFQHLTKVAEITERAVQRVFDLSFHSSTIEDDHDALWLALLNELRQLGAHTPNCSVTVRDGYIERKLFVDWKHTSREGGRVEVCFSVSLVAETSKPKAPSFCADIFWSSRCAEDMCDVDSDSSGASPRVDAAVPIAPFFLQLHDERANASRTVPNLYREFHQPCPSACLKKEVWLEMTLVSCQDMHRSVDQFIEQ